MNPDRKKRVFVAFAAALLLAACLLLPFWRGRAAETFAPRGSTVELPVIMYHSLVKDERWAAQYVCPIAQVESDLQWLRDNGYQSVSLAQLIAYADGTGTLPPKPVLITLDDGYRNNLTLLPALLEQYDAYAVIALVGEYTDIYTASGEDGSLHTCMSWEDAARAAGVERLELANHSYYFHHLTGRQGTARKGGEDREAWQAAFCSDVQALQRAVSQHCGVTPAAFAYPFGQITDGADDLLREMGFRVSLTCNELRSVLTAGDPGCLFSLGRYNRDGRWTTGEFMKRLLG